MRLNIGCGPVQPDGWVNIDTDRGLDVIPYSPTDPDWPVVFAAETVEGAVAHHVLQMVSWLELVPWLTAVRQSLGQTAGLRVSVPDFPGAYAAALEGNRDWFPISHDLEPSIDGALCLYLTQGGASRSIFTGPWLCDLFRRAGFVGVHETGPNRTHGPAWLTQLDNRPGESIYVEGFRA